jgi:sarcosine oxidase, subunit gamma
VPKKIGATVDDIACLGPDEWLLRAPEGSSIPAGRDLAVAITDISERSICLIVDGPRATTILYSGCPLAIDLFAVGRATRTIFETVEIILIRKAEDHFQVEVWRSFAPWLRTALTTAASH